MSEASLVDQLYEQARERIRNRDLDGAISTFESAAELDDARADVFSGLASARYMAGRFEDATEAYIRVTRLAPTDASAWINLGAVYNRMGEHQQALDALRKGVQRDKKSAMAYYNMGVAHRALKQQPMAVSAFREALRLNPEFAEAHQNLANSYVDMNNAKQAIEHYKKALAIRPDFERARQGLAAAEGTLQDSRAAFNPFGRLVDATQAAAAANPASSDRSLTDDERMADRQAVYAMVLDIQGAANELIRQQRDEVDSLVLALNRAVSQGPEAGGLLLEAYEEYQAAIERNGHLRTILRKRVGDLRTHESRIQELVADGA